MTKKHFECSCPFCKGACDFKPGWFKPNQIPSLLKHFKVKTVKGLLGPGKLAVDFWAGEPHILILSPNKKGNQEKLFGMNGHGQCVFFKEGKCSIHKIKPFECAELNHSDADKAITRRHKAIADSWKNETVLDDYRKRVDDDINSTSPFQFPFESFFNMPAGFLEGAEDRPSMGKPLNGKGKK